MADVSAKDGSQETLVNLAALITNLTLLPYITANLGYGGDFPSLPSHLP